MIVLERRELQRERTRQPYRQGELSPRFKVEGAGHLRVKRREIKTREVILKYSRQISKGTEFNLGLGSSLALL